MVKEVCSKIDSSIDCVQPFARLHSVKALIFELLVWVLLLCTSLLIPSMCLSAQQCPVSVDGIQTDVPRIRNTKSIFCCSYVSGSWITFLATS